MDFLSGTPAGHTRAVGCPMPSRSSKISPYRPAVLADFGRLLRNCALTTARLLHEVEAPDMTDHQMAEIDALPAMPDDQIDTTTIPAGRLQSPLTPAPGEIVEPRATILRQAQDERREQAGQRLCNRPAIPEIPMDWSTVQRGIFYRRPPQSPRGLP